MAFTKYFTLAAALGLAGMYGCSDDSGPITPTGGSPTTSGDSVITVGNQPVLQNELRGDSVLVLLTDSAGVTIDTVQAQRLTIVADSTSSGSVRLGTVEANQANLEAQGSGSMTIDTLKAEEANVELEQSGSFLVSNVMVDTLNLRLGGSGSTIVDSINTSTLRITGSAQSSGSFDAGLVRADTVVIDIKGSGSVLIDSLEATAIFVTMNGTGSCYIGGETAHQNLTISSAGSYQAGGLRTDTTTLSYSGSGNVAVWVERSFIVEHNGSGTVYYRGDPAIDKSGSGRPIPMGAAG
jgi:hypothetical protein